MPAPQIPASTAFVILNLFAIRMTATFARMITALPDNVIMKS